MFVVLLLVGIISSIGVDFAAAKPIGVCYGVKGSDLPSKQEVVDLYKTHGVRRMRIYYPDEETLEALRGSNIEVMLNVAKKTLPSLTYANAAADWVNKYVTPYSQDVKFKYIAVGNEIHPDDYEAQYLLPAMQNIQNAISSAKLETQIKVSTAIDTSLITNSYPPNNGTFSDRARSYIHPIIGFLVNNGAPLLASLYPYYAYAANTVSVGRDYALFTQPKSNSVGYQNLFDAMLDATYAALEKVNASNLQIVVSETGWPSAGGIGATSENAATYYTNLINHVDGGTPKRPGEPIETYLFAVFHENLKRGAEFKRHFGLFNHDKTAKYQLNFT